MRASVGLFYGQAAFCLLQCLLILLTDQTCTTLPGTNCTAASFGNLTLSREIHHCFKIDTEKGWECILNSCDRLGRLNLWVLMNMLFNLVSFAVYVCLPKFNFYTTLIHVFCEVLCRGWLVLDAWCLYSDWYSPWQLDFQPAFPMAVIFMSWIHLLCCVTVSLAFYWDQKEIEVLTIVKSGVYRVNEDNDGFVSELQHKPIFRANDVDVSHA
ncbi:unnamed protein product [Bursaphelenchus okinawaensis]|uniref:Uncharacterized protein n=1 Tax=Bursaphelenchus okinawaensis TaxID=465554 RepID=A0A811JTP9_9BILA|nr:unnamed protein product [Bursaphelenchus okinawaensis]CAG9082468.1 unnamed protein product [Bursaphelenchus okinawaensis]